MMKQISLIVNGSQHNLAPVPGETLSTLLRQRLRLTGTKIGCEEAECGACTVLVDGEPVVSCLVPVAQAESSEITTIEGLEGAHRLQQAFIKHGAAQCGICTPGMIMAALHLPPQATLEQIKVALAGNICRCTGYEAIYRAIQDA